MAKKNYDELAQQVLTLVGGKDNVITCLHCATRLRFNVKDKGLVQEEELQALKSVVGIQWFGEQIQLIIGTDVEFLYNAVCKIAGFEGGGVIQENLDAPQDQSVKATLKRMGSGALQKCAAVFSSLLPVLTACGMMTTLRLILTSFNLVPADNPVVVYMNAIGNVIFYFMPFFVGYTTAKAFKLNELYGILIAGCLMHPTIMGMAGSSIQYFFLNIDIFNYSSSLLPVFLCVALFSYVFKFIDARMPKNFRTLLTGLISCAIVIPILMCFVAPIGYHLGIWLAEAIESFYMSMGFVAGALFTGFLSFIIMTGVHHALNTVFLANFATLGYCYIKPALLLNNLAVAGSTLGYALRIKDKDLRATAIADGIMGIFGRSEPALYGFGFKYRTPLVGNVIGGMLAGALYTILGVRQYVSAPGNIFSLPSYLTSQENFYGMLASVIVALAASFVVSFILGGRDQAKMKQMEEAKV